MFIVWQNKQLNLYKKAKFVFNIIFAVRLCMTNICEFIAEKYLKWKFDILLFILKQFSKEWAQLGDEKFEYKA